LSFRARRWNQPRAMRSFLARQHRISPRCARRRPGLETAEFTAWGDWPALDMAEVEDGISFLRRRLDEFDQVPPAPGRLSFKSARGR